MAKQTKDQKRKAKLEKRRKAENARIQQQTEILISMLTEMCAPLLPEYTNDGKGWDLAGRTILYRLGQIAWNAEISQDFSFDRYAENFDSLDDKSKEIIRQDVRRLQERKRMLYPRVMLGIKNVTVGLRNGSPVLRLLPRELIRIPEALRPEIRLKDKFLASLEKLAAEDTKANPVSRYSIRASVITHAVKDFAASHTESEILTLCDELWRLQRTDLCKAVGKLLAVDAVRDMEAVWIRLNGYKEEFRTAAAVDSLASAATRVLRAKPEYLNVMAEEWLSHSNVWVRRACLTFTRFRLKEKTDNSLLIQEWVKRLSHEQNRVIQHAIVRFKRELPTQNCK